MQTPVCQPLGDTLAGQKGHERKMKTATVSDGPDHLLCPGSGAGP